MAKEEITINPIDRITVQNVMDSMKDLQGVTLDDVVGIRVMVLSQDAFDEGITDCAHLMLKQEMTYREHYGDQGKFHEYTQDHVYLDQDEGNICGNFEHDYVREGADFSAAEIKERCFDPALVDMIRERGWKVFWGAPYENETVEVVDFFDPKPTEHGYTAGTTSDT
jgi:hypothetical protein